LSAFVVPLSAAKWYRIGFPQAFFKRLRQVSNPTGGLSKARATGGPKIQNFRIPTGGL